MKSIVFRQKNIVISKNTVREAFLKIIGIEITSYPKDLKTFECVTAKCRDFYLRFRRNEDPVKWVLEIAVKDYFDRWANSVNFIQEIPFIVHAPIAINFNKSLNQARKVVKAQVFNWNSYFYSVMLTEGYNYKKE